MLQSNMIAWDKVFKSGLSKFWGRQPSKNLKGYGPLKHKYGLPQNLLSQLLNTRDSEQWMMCVS